MAFISVAEELTKRKATSIENKFIVKYLAKLDPDAVKIYLYSLYLVQNGQANYTLDDLCKKLDITEEKAIDEYKYLNEMELVSITSYSPFEIKILDCDNYYGKPKKLHPEKYEGLYDEIKAIISDRDVSPNEFREYLILLEDYGFERNALVMLVNYCVNYKGADIGWTYIRQTAKNFYADGVTSAAQVEERLSSYSASTAPLLKIMSACSIKRRPSVEDGALYDKWVKLGFDDEAIVSASKCFKAKRLEKLDVILQELYKNKKFDSKEIADYSKSKQSLYDTAVVIAKSLGVYAADPAPYVENYVSVWSGYGFSNDALKTIANYCFLSGRNSFDLMNDFVDGLYADAYVDDDSVKNLIAQLGDDDKFIKKILTACGLTRKIIPYDRQALARWRMWQFNEEMILKAAELSSGKNNPVAAMNYLLSVWKNKNIYTVEQIGNETGTVKTTAKAAQKERETEIYKQLYAKLATEDNDDRT